MARLAFFGTPAFAVPALQALLGTAHDVVGVVCQPDRPAGRGQHLHPPPVKVCALEAGLPVWQPTTLKANTDDGDRFFADFTALNVDLAVVVAYGRILPRRLLQATKCGFVNVHASLLPRWRGAAPIQRAIAAGDPETGICLMDVVPALDAGDVYATLSLAIHPHDDTGSLTTRLAEAGGVLLGAHIDGILAGSLAKVPQPAEGITYAEMIQNAEAQINWSRPAADVVNHVRAMSPQPGAFTLIDGERIKLSLPKVIPFTHADDKPLFAGMIVANATSFAVVTGDVAGGFGLVEFAEIQVPGKKRMTWAQYAAGRREYWRQIDA